MTEQKITKYFRLLLIILTLVLVGYLIWQNFSPIGSQVIIYGLQKNKFISPINPSTRIKPLACVNNECTQEMFNDPVYFDLLLARKFDSLKIKIYYKATEDIDIRIGMQTKEGWNYMIKNSDRISQDSGWDTAEYSFPLSVALVKQRHVNFLISAPGLKAHNSSIIIKQLTFDLSR